MHFLSNEEIEKWIEDYVERETAEGRQRVQDAEIAIMQWLRDMNTAESMGTTTRQPETMFKEMLNAIGDRLSDLACPDNEQYGEDAEDDEEHTELRKLSDDDDPGWVMGTIFKTVQHRMDCFRQKHMTVDELTQSGWGDIANYFRVRDMMYGTAKVKVLAVVKPQIETTAATTPPSICAEHMQTLEIILRESQMPAVISRLGCSQLRLGSQNRQLHKFLPILLPDAAPNLTLIQDAMPVELLSVYRWIMHPELITI